MKPGGSAIELLTGRELYERVIREAVLSARTKVWIATANLKDMHVPGRGGYEPILRVFERMANEGVRFRVIHSDLPSRPFRDTFEELPTLLSGALELQVCPRSHWKMVVVDSIFGYFGSANFTGAGLGAKKPARRNLEIGAVTEERSWVSSLEKLFDDFWIGKNCAECSFRDRCPDPI